MGNRNFPEKEIEKIQQISCAKWFEGKLFEQVVAIMVKNKEQ